MGKVGSFKVYRVHKVPKVGGPLPRETAVLWQDNEGRPKTPA